MTLYMGVKLDLRYTEEYRLHVFWEYLLRFFGLKRVEATREIVDVLRIEERNNLYPSPDTVLVMKLSRNVSLWLEYLTYAGNNEDYVKHLFVKVKRK
jgi:hypothetical protein